MNGVFVNEAPVLSGKGGFLTSQDLFPGGIFREERVQKFSEGS
jgi:hypothetical protein